MVIKMEYRKFGNTIVLRLEVGEEIVESLTKLCAGENIRLAQVSGLGAANEITVGIFDTAEKQYYSKTYTGDFEIGALTGNLTRKEGEPYLHLHIVFGNPQKELCAAGHLNRAVISATAELLITVLDGEVGRRLDEAVGLNLFQF